MSVCKWKVNNRGGCALVMAGIVVGAVEKKGAVFVASDATPLLIETEEFDNLADAEAYVVKAATAVGYTVDGEIEEVLL